jgi:hypothetical protein
MSRTRSNIERTATQRSRRRGAVTAIAAVTTFAIVPLVAMVNPGAPASAATRMPNATISPQGVTIAAGSSVDLVVRLSSAKPTNLSVALQGPRGVSGLIYCASSRDCTVSVSATGDAPEATELVNVVLRSGSLSRRIPIAVHVKRVDSTPPPPTTPLPTTDAPIPSQAPAFRTRHRFAPSRLTLAA